jgi:ABC-2 type transport system ATP-binding protein
MGKTILVSSHILPELADICNKIGIIERGVLLVNGAVTDVMKQVRTKVILNVGVVDGIDGAGEVLTQHQDIEIVERRDGHLVVTLKDEATDYSFIPTLLIGKGFRVNLFKEEEMNLETAFMHLTKGIVQ